VCPDEDLDKNGVLYGDNCKRRPFCFNNYHGRGFYIWSVQHELSEPHCDDDCDNCPFPRCDDASRKDVDKQ